MAVFAIYIEKSAMYFGERRTFGNTYHYSTNALEGFQDQTVAEEIAAAETSVTSDAVTFERWQSWGPTDGPQFENVMREEGDLSGTGMLPISAGVYREACALVVWPLTRSAVTNRKRWLRKFLRSAPGTDGVSADVATGAEALPASAITALENYATRVQTIDYATGEAELSTAEGDLHQSSGVVRPYLYTRQIGE